MRFFRPFLKILFLTTFIHLFSIESSAQCTPDTSDYLIVYPADSTLPCVVRNKPFTDTISFRIDNTIDAGPFGFPGVMVNVSQIQVTYVGLPNGFTYACDNANCTYSGGTRGCIVITGATSDSVGKRPIGFTWLFSGTVNGTPISNVELDSAALAEGGLLYQLCIIDSGEYCPNDSTFLTIQEDSFEICLGDSVQFQTAISNPGPDFTFSWSPSDGLSDTTSASPFAKPNSTTTYTLVAADTVGNEFIDTFVVFVADTLSINISTESNTVCSNDIIEFASATTSEGLEPNYQWFINGIPVGIDTPTFIPESLQDGDTITCQLTSSVPCLANQVVMSNQIIVTVLPAPSVSAEKDTVMYLRDTVQLSATGAETYLWEPSAGLTNATIANPKASPELTTNYKVTGSIANGCSDQAEVTVEILYHAGLERVDPQNFIRISPNPTDGIVELKLLQIVDETVHVKVLNALGQEVTSKNIFNQSGVNSTQLDLSAYQSGLYLVSFKVGQQLFYTKLFLD